MLVAFPPDDPPPRLRRSPWLCVLLKSLQ